MKALLHPLLVLLLAACADAGSSVGANDGGMSAPDSAYDTGPDATSESTPDVTSDKEPEDVPELPPDDAENVVCPEILLPVDSPVSAAEVVCAPGRTATCTCRTGSPGFRVCDGYGQWGPCLCTDMLVIRDTEEGMYRHGPPIVLPARLVTPLSGRRPTSRRPTFRWVLPEGMTRARVELCEDRPCTRRITQAEVTGTSWRPSERLLPGVIFWRVLGLRGDGSVGWTSATWEFGVRRRDTPVDTIGRPLLDFNRDGYDDAMVAGGVWLGSRSGGRPAPMILRSRPSWHAIGDVNGDGYSDLATNSDQLDPGWSLMDANRDGTVRLHFGAPGCPLQQSRRVFQPAFGITYGFGSHIALGDFDGDGFDDLLAMFKDGLALYKGGEEGLAREPHDTVRVVDMVYRLGGVFNGQDSQGMRMIGDVDRDGYADLAACSFRIRDDGMVQVFYGNPEGRLGARVQTFRGRVVGELGDHVVGADFTGDGFSDLVVGAFNQFHLFTGSPDGLRRTSSHRLPAAMSYTPARTLELCPAGDVDGDGLADLFVRDTALYRSFGAAGFANAPNFYSSFIEIRSPGDMDGDGIDDLLAFPRNGASLIFRGGQLPPGTPSRILGISPGFCTE